MTTEPDPNALTPVRRLTYSVDEAAIALGVSKATIYRLIMRQKLRPLPGLRHKRIPVRQLESFAAAGAN